MAPSNSSLPVIPSSELEPERYELSEARRYTFELERRDFIRRETVKHALEIGLRALRLGLHAPELRLALRDQSRERRIAG